MKRILFVCTSNKDRSPALQAYFHDNYPHYSFSSAGINYYFCNKKDTTHISSLSKMSYYLVVFCEDIHREICENDYELDAENCVTLNLGEYQKGSIGEDYLTKAELILKPYL